jgi:hypothetical protein
MKLYTLSVPDFMDHADAGPWRSYDLQAEGDTLEELLDSAVYWQTDQDGGSLGDRPADDSHAQVYIEKWFREKTKGRLSDTRWYPRLAKRKDLDVKGRVR